MSEVKEVKTLCLVRVPPGDRWREPQGTEVFETLTEGLETVFQKTGCVEYRFSAKEGKIWTIEETVLPAPKPKSFSIYGDEY